MSPSNVTNLPSPWDLFREELDGLFPELVHVDCIGGFVVSLFYGLPRPTADVDYFAVLPYHCVDNLQEFGPPGLSSARARPTSRNPCAAAEREA
jgi:hypothetical protein